MKKSKHGKKILIIDEVSKFSEDVIKMSHEFGMKVDSIACLSELEDLEILEGYDAFFIEQKLKNVSGYELAEFFHLTTDNKPVVIVNQQNHKPTENHLMPNVIGHITNEYNAVEFLEQSKALLSQDN